MEDLTGMPGTYPLSVSFTTSHICKCRARFPAEAPLSVAFSILEKHIKLNHWTPRGRTQPKLQLTNELAYRGWERSKPEESRHQEEDFDVTKYFHRDESTVQLLFLILWPSISRSELMTSQSHAQWIVELEQRFVFLVNIMATGGEGERQSPPAKK